MKSALIRLIAEIREETVAAQAAIKLVKYNQYTEVQALIHVARHLEAIAKVLQQNEEIIKDNFRAREEDTWQEL